MKVTLELPDDFHKKAEAIAKQQGKSVTAFLRDSIVSVISNFDSDGKIDIDPTKYISGPESLERLKKWRQEEAEFMKSMEGPDLDRRSSDEIIRDGRR